MPNTAAIGGTSLTTSLTTIVTNTAADKKVRTYEIDFLNIDGVNNADVTQCQMIDASAANTARPILPVNATVRARDALTRRITLDPGDSIQASASVPGDIYALVQQTFEEAAP